MSYFSLEDLKDKIGAQLIEAYELLKGCWIDSCVEDQFRLAVYYAQTNDDSKKWWDFTAERKKYRLENGYPSNRPTNAWHEVVETEVKK